MSDRGATGFSQYDAPPDVLERLIDLEIEQALLGAVMLDNKAYDAVVDIVAVGDFVTPVHARIYDAIGTLIASGTEATPITLRHLFERDQSLVGLGGAVYLRRLAEGMFSAAGAPDYARTIRDLAQRREMVIAARDIIADAASLAPDRRADAVLDEAEQRLYEIAEKGARQGSPRPLSDALDLAVASAEAAHRKGGAEMVDTGLDLVDRIISGLGPGDLVVLAGRPAMGKSACAGTIAANCGLDGKHVLFFSLEMTRVELAQRWIAGYTGIATDKQRQGRLDTVEWPKLIEAKGRLAKLPILVDDQSRLSVNQMRQRARRAKRRQGLDLVIIDHLQLIRQGGRQESRRLEIGDATSMLKAVAKELQVPVLLLSQLSRAVEGRDDKRPTLSDLKESGDIEQDADVVMFLYREEYYLTRTEPKRKPSQRSEAHAAALADWQDQLDAAKGLAEIIVAKNRHGRTGVAKLAFDGERQRFDNLHIGG